VSAKDAAGPATFEASTETSAASSILVTVGAGVALAENTAAAVATTPQANTAATVLVSGVEFEGPSEESTRCRFGGAEAEGSAVAVVDDAASPGGPDTSKTLLDGKETSSAGLLST
jgi:hypothetical protein